MISTPATIVGPTAILLLTLLSGCHIGPPPIQGSGVSETEARHVTDFDEVDVSNAIRLELTVGPAASLLVTADDNIVPLVKTELDGKRLRVFIDHNTRTEIGITVKATTPTLKALEASGATQSTVTGVKTEKFELDVSGASTCNLGCKSNRINVNMSGSSRCTLTGEAERLTIDSSGASHLIATDLTAKVAEGRLSGASTADVFASEEVSAEASGASAFRYAGDPEKVHRRVSGAATVRAK